MVIDASIMQNIIPTSLSLFFFFLALRFNSHLSNLQPRCQNLVLSKAFTAVPWLSCAQVEGISTQQCRHCIDGGSLGWKTLEPYHR